MCTYKEYRESVESFAQEAHERIADGEDEGDVFHEITDNADWVIYPAHSIAVLAHSENDDAAFDELGKDALDGCDSTASVYTRLAFYAMRQDIMEAQADIAKDEG